MKYLNITIIILILTIKSINAQNNDSTFIESIRVNDSSKTIKDTLEKNESPNFQIRKNISIIGVGDIMLGTNFPNDSYLPPNEGKDMLKPVDSLLKNADLTFANMEGVILTGEGKIKKCSNPKVCYAFKSPDCFVANFKNAGIDVVSLANNHIGDFGDIGKSNTMKILADSGIHFAGLNTVPYTTFIKDSIKYGFCAFSPNTGTMQITDFDEVKRIVKHLDSISDIVIVSFHGGAEGSNYRHITRETELYLGENRGNPYEFSRIAIDAGADIIFGHGPHVTRAIDIYKNRIIAYSLGNFATYGRFNLTGSKGVAPILKVNVNKNGEFINGQIFSIKQIGRGMPVLDKNNTALKEIISLTKEDFPKGMLNISYDGIISLKE